MSPIVLPQSVNKEKYSIFLIFFYRKCAWNKSIMFRLWADDVLGMNSDHKWANPRTLKGEPVNCLVCRERQPFMNSKAKVWASLKFASLDSLWIFLTLTVQIEMTQTVKGRYTRQTGSRRNTDFEALKRGETQRKEEWYQRAASHAVSPETWKSRHQESHPTPFPTFSWAIKLWRKADALHWNSFILKIWRNKTHFVTSVRSC